MARPSSSSTRPIKIGLYFVALYAWYSLCAAYFQPAAQPAQLHRSGRHHARHHEEEAVLVVAEEPPAAAAVARAEAASEPAPLAPRAAAAAPAATAPAGSMTAETAAMAAAANCPASRRPYHVLLTAQGSIYNQWQARIMYHHWQKQRAADGPCTEMSAFTRLCASPDGLPDGVEKYIPSVFVTQLTSAELAKYGHFGVLNRPHSVVEFFKQPAVRRVVTEQYVMIAETDHVLMKPLPNLMKGREAAAHAFGYMHAGRHHQKVIELCDPTGDWSKLQPVGPSPLIIDIRDLERVAPRWLQYSYKLRGDPMPAKFIQDWVLEMWAYAIAAASLDIRHTIVPNYQIEPNAYAHTPADFHKHSYIFHYTYGIEYKLSGQPQGYNTIGEWSLDKRHYGGAYPPPNLDPPPKDGPNPSSRWLWQAWNDAITAAGDTWPQTNAMGTVGWRRESISAAEIRKSPLATAVVGTRWTWAGIKALEYQAEGLLKTPWGVGKWGLAMRPKGMPQCLPPRQCLFVDFSGAAHHAYFEWSEGGNPQPMLKSFKSVRVGDGEVVNCSRLP